MTESGHEYVSTACWHAQHGAEGLHKHCRFICKWCDAACRCECHGDLGGAVLAGEKLYRREDQRRPSGR